MWVGVITYNVTHGTIKIGPQRLGDVGCSMKLLDNEGGHVTSAMGCQGSIVVANATLWWPYLMSENPGYMYTLMVKFLVLSP